MAPYFVEQLRLRSVGEVRNFCLRAFALQRILLITVFLLTLNCLASSVWFTRDSALAILSGLRLLTWGKRFLLFLPDFYSAYYDSFVSALGRSLPPSLGLSRICCTWSSFWRKQWVGRGGGWWAHPPALATLGKMALGTSVGFLGVGQSN